MHQPQTYRHSVLFSDGLPGQTLFRTTPHDCYLGVGESAAPSAGDRLCDVRYLLISKALLAEMDGHLNAISRYHVGAVFMLSGVFVNAEVFDVRHGVFPRHWFTTTGDTASLDWVDIDGIADYVTDRGELVVGRFDSFTHTATSGFEVTDHVVATPAAFRLVSPQQEKHGPASRLPLELYRRDDAGLRWVNPGWVHLDIVDDEEVKR